MTKNDIHYSYVGFHNITERMLNFMLLTYGSAIGFPTGNNASSFQIDNFVYDVKALRPSFLFDLKHSKKFRFADVNIKWYGCYRIELRG